VRTTSSTPSRGTDRGRLDKNGKVIAWRHRSVAPTIARPSPPMRCTRPFELAWADRHAVRDRQFQCENPEAAAHTRIGWFRSVSNIPRAFAVQSMVGELASATNRDQKDMLLELIGSRGSSVWSVKDRGIMASLRQLSIDTARLRRVVELVAEKGGWGRSVPKGHGSDRGAPQLCQLYRHIVEVSVGDKGKLTVHQVDTAIDCGTYVNPERIQSQMEGAAIMGLSLARYGEISFKDGKVQQGNFDDFPVIRIDEAPLVTNVHIVPVAADTRPAASASPGASVCTGPGQRHLRRDRQTHPGPSIGKQLET